MNFFIWTKKIIQNIFVYLTFTQKPVFENFNNYVLRLVLFLIFLIIKSQTFVAPDTALYSISQKD